MIGSESVRFISGRFLSVLSDLFLFFFSAHFLLKFKIARFVRIRIETDLHVEIEIENKYLFIWNWNCTRFFLFQDLIERHKYFISEISSSLWNFYEKEETRIESSRFSSVRLLTLKLCFLFHQNDFIPMEIIVHTYIYYELCFVLTNVGLCLHYPYKLDTITYS